MSTGREDFDQLIKFRSIPAKEPTFTVRAQDKAAADTVRAWTSISFHLGVAPAELESALVQADAMDKWPIKKITDDDSMSDAKRRRLTYGFERRAWRARADSDTDHRFILAEQRGATAAMSRPRQVISAARNLLDGWADAKPALDAACTVAAVHGQPYAGPDLSGLIAALTAALETVDG